MENGPFIDDLPIFTCSNADFFVDFFISNV